MKETRLRIHPDATFQFVDAETVRGRALHAFEFDVQLFDVLQSFAEPHTLAEVHADLDTDMSLADFSELCQQFITAGILHSDAPVATDAASAAMDEQVSRMWNSAVFDHEPTMKALADCVQEGVPVVIRSPFARDFADQVHAELAERAHWTPYERATGFFHYRHHNIYQNDDNPPALVRCRELFNAPRFRALAGRLAGCETDGTARVAASYYQPGDYSLPHEDHVGQRAIAFIWYLTRDWRPEWGGHFYWCRTGTYIRPSFNTMVAFRVTRTSSHFVCPVSAQARGKRLAVSGWWTHAADESAQSSGLADPTPTPEGEILIRGTGDLRELAEGVWAL